MPVTFGSVGDIISVSILVKDLVDALNESKGSKKQYEDVVRELWLLDRALLEVDLTSRTHANTPQLSAVCETARQAVEDCRVVVKGFTDKIKQYGKSFSAGISGPRHTVGRATKKIQWQICQKDEVSRFRAQISAHALTMTMLLSTATAKLEEISHDKLEAKCLEDKLVQTQQCNAIEALQRKLQETNRLIGMGNVFLASVKDRLRIEWLEKLGKDLKGIMQRVTHTNVLTYNTVIAIQQSLAVRFPATLNEEPFLLEDAIGRIAPFPLKLVCSWDAFQSILEARFRKLQGAEKIRNKEYVLQDQATGKDIDMSSTWGRAFLPGQHLFG
ncbi:MAG: hypothetical protein Q9165_007678 [Trypethelium subeluteriae]